jgi:hypothetical protein
MAKIEDSILLSVKKLIGYDEDYDAFDIDLIILINSYISQLVQMGIGPSNGYKIESKEDLWTDFIGESKVLEHVKEFIFIKTRIIFDPPVNSAVLSALKDVAEEAKWRAYVEAETSEGDDSD